jgi:hypothetical protein
MNSGYCPPGQTPKPNPKKQARRDALLKMMK